MWIDDDYGLDNNSFLKFEQGYKFPIICPKCKNKDVHFYMHIHNPKNNHGGLWAWCSSCKMFSHGSLIVPDYWKNCLSVDESELTAVPEYLDNIRYILDKHTNSQNPN